MNLVVIMGTITRDPEVKYTQSGSAIVSFGIATNDRWKDANGQQQEKAHFFDVTAFGRQAETINQYFHKGSRILIEGSLDYQAWKAQDGSNRSKVGIKLSRFTFVDKAKDNQGQQQQPQQGGYGQAQQTPQPQYQQQQAPQQAPRQAPQQQPQYQQPTQNQQGAAPVYDQNGQEIPLSPMNGKL